MPRKRLSYSKLLVHMRALPRRTRLRQEMSKKYQRNFCSSKLADADSADSLSESIRLSILLFDGQISTYFPAWPCLKVMWARQNQYLGTDDIT